MKRPGIIALVAVALATWIGCDTVEPVDDTRLVVEGFLDSSAPLPAVRIRRTLPPGVPYSEPAASVLDARVDVVLGESVVRYVPEAGHPGYYRPEGNPSLRPSPGMAFSFTVSWRDTGAKASGVVPPEMNIEDVQMTIPDEPVSAVLLDSLTFADSLATGAYTGFIYPIEVTVRWEEAEADGWPAADSWVRAQLKPYAAFSSPVVDLFLRSEEILRESEQVLDSDGLRAWTGVYAVGVAREDDPLPEHLLRVALVRSGSDYARFAASKDAPERREPVSNLAGAAGIFTAISVDSTQVRVERR